jgi:hypothetical protein
MEDGQVPGAARRGAARGVGPRGGAKRPPEKTQRVQLHLSGTTVKRLAVHAGLVGQNQSRIADRILTSYLAHRGQGRELFPPPGPEDSPGEADPDSV